MNNYYIYILSNSARMLYVGLTTDLESMFNKHRKQQVSIFKGNFSFNKLLYVEEIGDIQLALQREKELKAYSVYEIQDMVKVENPSLRCLFDDVRN